MPIGRNIETPKEGDNSKNKSTINFESEIPKYTLDEVIASKETKENIFSLIALKEHHYRVFNDMGFSSTHKFSRKFIVNFYGPPGTGKTITAHAIANAFNKKILVVDYSQIESKYVGDTPKNLKRLFDFATDDNCLIFFDEADAILSRRVTNMQSATDTSVNQTRSVLLNILNDYDGDVIFASNFITNYDPAFMRRISKHIEFKLPDDEARHKLFSKYIPKALINDIDIGILVSKSEGVSAADIETATLLSGFSAASKGNNKLKTEDINEQIISIKKSREENNKKNYTIKTSPISEEQVNSQIGEII